MKKISFLLAVMLIALVACDSEDKEYTIGYTELPQQAQTFLANNFDGVQISYILKEIDGKHIEYVVSFVNGGYVKFDNNGLWETVSCYNTGVPDSVIPTTILDYFKDNYPTNKIVEIDQNTTRYDVELDNGFEFVFDKSGNLIDIDYN